MGDVPARRRHFLEAVEPTLKVPRGETSLAAVRQRRYGDPAPHLDPERERVKCDMASCWREAHTVRGEDDGNATNLCPSCAETWDAIIERRRLAERRQQAAQEAQAEAAVTSEPAARRVCGAPTPDAPNETCIEWSHRCQDPEHAEWRAARTRREQARFQEARGIAPKPREEMPSRQDRHEEYDARNAKRRRERRMAQASQSSMPSATSSVSTGGGSGIPG